MILSNIDSIIKDPLNPIVKPSPDKTDITKIQPATINTNSLMDIATPPLEKYQMQTKQNSSQSQ